MAPSQDLVLHVSLRHITPAIWRRLLLPREYTLTQLHRTLQLVFAWQECHLHEFEIGERRFEAPRLPFLLGGERASPPEDSGGPGGFEALVKGLASPRTRAGREFREWVGPDYDPSRFDAWQVGRMLTLAAAYGAI